MLSRMLISAVLCAALCFASAAARAEYPEKPIQYILHVSPGGATDVMARKIAMGLEKELGVAVPVENKAGGRGAAQLADLAKSPPDGYTIAAVTSTHIGAFNQTLKQYNIDSFDWIVRLVNEPYLIVVNSQSKLNSLKDIVDAANKEPGSVVMAGFVRGSGGHFAWEMMAAAAGLESQKVRWVPFDSVGDAVTSVVGGHAEVAIAYVDLVKSQVAAGNLRVIGIMSDERVPQFPDVSTLTEQCYKIDTSWQQMRGIIGPKGMPDAVKTKIATAVQKVLQTEELTSYIKESSLVSAYQGPEDFTAFAKAQDELTKSWMKKLSLTR